MESSTDAEGKEKMNALTVSNLKKEYPCFHLKEVSFSVGKGRIVGLIGRNGAGKTTILKSIMNLISSEGKIEYFGRPLRDSEQYIKQKVGYVSGGFDFYPLKTLRLIGKTVAAFYNNWDERIYREYLERFSLDENKKVHDLSEGMKVKFSITLALSHGAEFLIMDEPTSGLDPLSREEFCDIILTLAQEKNISVLFSTHITSDLMRIADDIIYISDGEILLECGLQELINRYKKVSFKNVDAVKACKLPMLELKRVKEGYEALVKREDLSHFEGEAKDVDLDEIIIHLETEKDKKKCF